MFSGALNCGLPGKSKALVEEAVEVHVHAFSVGDIEQYVLSMSVT